LALGGSLLNDPLKELRGGQLGSVVTPEPEHLYYKFINIHYFQSVGYNQEANSPGVLEVECLSVHLKGGYQGQIAKAWEVPRSCEGLV
jgi:hypothetical protein